MAESIPTNAVSETMAWCVNFMAVVTPTPATYGLDAGEVAALQVLVDDFQTNYDLAGVVNRIPINPGGYTKPNRAAMYSARDAALSALRPVAVQIQANDGIADVDKLAAGIVPRNFDRTPTYVPATAPVLTLLNIGIGTHMVGIADETTPNAKRRPLGAIGAEIYVGTDAAPLPVTGLSFDKMTSRTPVIVNYDASQAGQVATIAARWVGTRGDVGPWSASLNANVVWST